jgi:Uma2 family endonuclease
LLLGPFAVALSNRNVVEPDLLFITATRRHILSERACEGGPDLVVEILSCFQPAHTERDQSVKRELYARHNVTEYWILEPDNATVLALSKPVVCGGAGKYTSERVYRIGDILTTTAIPGLAIPVAMIYADPWRRMKLW